MSDTYTPALLEDIRRTADLCVKCNICTSVCPVVPVTDLFPGPKYVGPQAQRFRDPAWPRLTIRWTTVQAAASARWCARTASR